MRNVTSFVTLYRFACTVNRSEHQDHCDMHNSKKDNFETLVGLLQVGFGVDAFTFVSLETIPLHKR
jgi:uncharacterized protein YcgL (UPF0745 family)